MIALLPDLLAAPRCFLARSSPIPPAPDAWAACAIKPPSERREEKIRSADRPHKRWIAVGAWSPIDGNMAAPARGPPFEYSLKHPSAGRAIIGHIGHQLPCCLPDFGSAAGLADIGNIVLPLKHP